MSENDKKRVARVNFVNGAYRKVMETKGWLAVLLVAVGSVLTAPSALAYPANSKYGVIIPNQLYVTIYDEKLSGAHDAPAWTLVTDGLKAVGQDELILTIPRAKEQTLKDVPKEAIVFFRTVYNLAKEGKIVHTGGFTKFVDQFWLVAPQFRGLIYLKEAPPEGVLAPLGSLVAIPVTSEELQAYELGGPLRVTECLAVQSSFFPFPTWCDPNRKSVFSTADIEEMKKEPIIKSSHMSLEDASIISTPSQYQLALPLPAQDKLIDVLKKIPVGSPLVLWLGLDPRADSALYWTKEGNAATTAPGSKVQRTTGSFLFIVPGVDKPNFGRYRDGFVVMLTKDQWKQFQTAINSKQGITLDDTEGKMKFTVEIQKPMPADWMQKRSYTSTGGWVEYSHEAKTPVLSTSTHPIEPGPAKVIFGVLKDNDAVIRQSISSDDYSNYVKAVHNAVLDYFASRKVGTKAYEMVVQAHLVPRGKATYKIFHRPAGIPDEVIKALYARLSDVKSPDPDNPLDYEFILNVSP